MKHFVSFLLILMWPISGFSQTVVVVSGEHDGYTRLAFAVSPDRDWNLVYGPKSATLVFPTQSLEFEDDGVFARIPKTRLASTHINQSEGGAEYRMTLGCDCDVTAFAYLGTYIVVDIADAIETSITATRDRHFAPVLSPARLPSDNSRPPEYVSWIQPRAPHYISSPHRVNFPAPTDTVGLKPTQNPGTPPNTSHPDVAQVAPDVATEIDQELQEAVDAARNSLLQQLTLAADQGLLDLNRPIPEIPQAVDALPEVKPDDVPVVFEELESENQILIQTVTTRDSLAARGGTVQQNDHCPSPEDLDMAAWGSGEDFFDELSSARRKLLREFDEPNFAEVERVIRTYLRYGFGAEARSYLQEGGKNIAQSSLLLDFAAIVDGQTVQPSGPLSQATDCDGAAGLWALVGTYPTIDTDIDDQPSIVEAFAGLPPDIRRLVGPRLASAFLDRRLETTARQVADILERAPGDHGIEHELVVGNLMQIEGSTPEAEQVYQVLAEDNSQVAIDALIELATLGLAQDRFPPRHLLVDLGASAKIWRGTRMGGELRRLEALWLAKQGRERDAIDLLVVEMQHDLMNAGILQETAEEILSTLSTGEILKSNFAEVVHTYATYIPTGEKADTLRLEIAEKLLLAGLPDYAIEMLHPPIQRTELRAILMAANASIQAFRPEAALLLLDGLADDPARKLRVEAYLGMGEFGQTLAQLEQFTDMSEATVAPHWFKGDWAATIETNQAAAEIRKRFFPDNMGEIPHGPDEISASDTLTLSAMQELLIDSQSRSAELENALLQP